MFRITAAQNIGSDVRAKKRRHWGIMSKNPLIELKELNYLIELKELKDVYL